MIGKIVYANPMRFYIGDREVAEAEFHSTFPDKKIGKMTGKMMTEFNRPSDALAVHPDQVQEAYDDSVKRGVRTEYLADGRPIMRDRQHQKRFLAAYGHYNKDGGFGD